MATPEVLKEYELAQASLEIISQQRSLISQQELNSVAEIRSAIAVQVAPIVDMLPQCLPVSSRTYGEFATYVATVKYDPRKNVLFFDEYQIKGWSELPYTDGAGYKVNLKEARLTREPKQLEDKDWLNYAESVVNVVELAREAIVSGKQITDDLAKGWLDQLNKEAEGRMVDDFRKRFFPEASETDQ